MDLGTGSVSPDAATPALGAGTPDQPAAPDVAARRAALARVNRAARIPIGWLWEWAKIFQIAVVLFLFVRAFLVEAYKIPSGSMEGTLLVGDFLLVNKLVYGAEIPFTGRRLPRVEAPERGDVVVFQWPEDVRKNFVKRLVGLPGDTLAMRGGVLYVNGAPQQERYVTHTEPGADPSYEDFRWQREYLARSAAEPVWPAQSVVGPRTAIAAAPGRTQTVGFVAPEPRPGRNPGDHPSRNNWGPLVVPDDSYFVLGDNRDNSLDSRYWGFVPDSLLRGRPLVVYYSYAPDSARRFAWLTAVRWGRLGERVR